MEFNIVEALMLVICIYLLSEVTKLNHRVKGLQSKLDQIAIHTGVPELPVNDELQQLLNEGKDIEAVKRARETLGLSLVEAKQYIDALKAEST